MQYIWLFPILFIFHDFEEIIFMRAWINKNRSFLRGRFPVLAPKMFAHFDPITTSAFALGVAEEFILISLITIISAVLNSYDIWIGSFMAFTIHLVIHCLQALIVRKYVPVLLTSLVCLPICLYIIYLFLQTTPIMTIISYSILCLIIMVINIVILFKMMPIFGKWIAQYEQ
ncbi:HXXEE domain-containing protein [Desulfitobacterium sp. Sab5]|uniref:HXXEE domain-containing protein n=1 Tax=Desulfitobacterium nosdiversum TaxID=3375356 RepID=UPI003CF8FB38